jgi:putative MATE family efflux protein
MQKESRLQSFLNDPARALWSMALPIIAGMMVQTLFNVVDIMFIGWLGADEVTAVAFVSPLFFIIIGLTVGLGAGVTASIAQYIGKKDKRNADNCAEHAILLGIVITVLLTILGVYFGRDLLILLGAYDHILDTASSYLKILTFGIGGVVFSLFFRAILAGEGETTIPMIIGLVGTIANVILDPIFIFLLEYGVDGAAIATVLSQAIMLVMYFTVIFVMKKTFISFNFRHFRYTPNILNVIFKVGIPSSLSMLIISFGQAVLNKILINYSSESVAAYQIVSRIDMLLFMPCLGIAIALTTIVGMFFGAKEFSKLVWIVKYGISRG